MKTTDEIASEVRTLVDRLITELHLKTFSKIPKGGLCLYYMLVGYSILQENGYHPLFQAGSSGWKILDDDKDDGISPKYLAFEWSPNSANSIKSMMNGQLPEVHAWLTLAPNIIVDFSTHTLPTICKEIIGIEWRTKEPPKYLWTPYNEIPESMWYTPNNSATFFIVNSALHLYYTINQGSDPIFQKLGIKI